MPVYNGLLSGRLRPWYACYVLLISALLMCVATPGFADCELSGGRAVTVSLGEQVSVPLTTRVGQVFQTVTLPPGALMMTCDAAAEPMSLRLGPVTPMGDGDGIINTAYPGLGVRVTLTPDGVAQGIILSGLPQVVALQSGTQHVIVPAIRVELIKTSTALRAGQLSSGALFSVPVALVKGGATTVVTLQSAPLTLEATGCLLLTPNLSVLLPSVPSRDFGHVGKTSGNTSFSLQFQCAKGQLVRMKASGVASLEVNGNTLGVLANTAVSNVATGVGIQVMFNGNPVPLNSVDWLALGEYSDEINIPFVAHYYQTSRSVSAGDVEAMMSITMNYD